MIYDVNGHVVGAEGMSAAMQQALLDLSESVAYINDNGPECYQAFYDEMYPNRELESIAAVLNLGCYTVMAGDNVERLRPYIKVTASYGDGYTSDIKDFTLSGTIASGSNTVTVGYMGETATVTATAVNALPSGYTRLEYVYTDGRQYINPSLNSDDVDFAEYEVMVRSQWFNKGGNILSSDNCKFPYLSGDNTNGFRSRIQFNHAGNGDNKVSSGSYLFPWSFDERHTLSGFGSGGSVAVDGVQLFAVPRGSAASDALYIFAGGASRIVDGMPNESYAFMGRLYGMKLYKNSTLIRNYIPCKDSTGEAGLYDLVTNTFLKSASEKKLLRGGEV